MSTVVAEFYFGSRTRHAAIGCVPLRCNIDDDDDDDDGGVESDR
jgi:hypothetical protein